MHMCNAQVIKHEVNFKFLHGAETKNNNEEEIHKEADP